MKRFRFKKLDIFIARQFLVLFVGAFFICQFVLMMQFLWRYIDELIGKGLSLEIMAQFFWYMGLMLVPQALPLAILLSSLITFGNLGESSELTAIKAAGISLMQSFRSLIIISTVICVSSFFFQNNIGPEANKKITQLLISMKQKSPELEIPEGVFYDGIPETNMYVQKKDMKTGKLYGIMVYRMTNSYEDQAIILADSGMLQSTAEKKHLKLTLWNGEWFENLDQAQIGESAAVPYQRETFFKKILVIDFDGDFNLADAGALSNDARTKSLAQIKRDCDSLNHFYDSIGNMYYRDEMNMALFTGLTRKDTLQAEKQARQFNFDSLMAKVPAEKRVMAVSMADGFVQQHVSDLEFKSMITSDGDKIIRVHKIESIKKFTLALSCLIFFFIGAPLGAIIRKGGLGVPVIISVLVFIVYYILDNTGYRMSRGGMWSIWFGEMLAPAVLIPLSVFVSYKANNDSVVFNMDALRERLIRILGLRVKRHIFGKEVIINEPDYVADADKISKMSEQVSAYATAHKLASPPNIIKVFFKYQPDHKIEAISAELESIIEDLSNTRDGEVLTYINQYPVLITKAHTRPFEKRWLNILSVVVLPMGIFFYFRMWKFRLRLHKDLRQVLKVNQLLINRINKITLQDK